MCGGDFLKTLFPSKKKSIRKKQTTNYYDYDIESSSSKRPRDEGIDGSKTVTNEKVAKTKRTCRRNQLGDHSGNMPSYQVENELKKTRASKPVNQITSSKNTSEMTNSYPRSKSNSSPRQNVGAVSSKKYEESRKHNFPSRLPVSTNKLPYSSETMEDKPDRDQRMRSDIKRSQQNMPISIKKRTDTTNKIAAKEITDNENAIATNGSEATVNRYCLLSTDGTTFANVGLNQARGIAITTIPNKKNAIAQNDSKVVLDKSYLLPTNNSILANGQWSHGKGTGITVSKKENVPIQDQNYSKADSELKYSQWKNENSFSAHHKNYTYIPVNIGSQTSVDDVIPNKGNSVNITQDDFFSSNRGIYNDKYVNKTSRNCENKSESSILPSVLGITQQKPNKMIEPQPGIRSSSLVSMEYQEAFKCAKSMDVTHEDDAINNTIFGTEFTKPETVKKGIEDPVLEQHYRGSSAQLEENNEIGKSENYNYSNNKDRAAIVPFELTPTEQKRKKFLENINQLRVKAEKFHSDIDSFCESSSSTRHYYINENLTRIMLELDALNVEYSEELRLERKAVIKYIYGLLDKLEEKAEQYDNLANINNSNSLVPCRGE